MIKLCCPLSCKLRTAAGVYMRKNEVVVSEDRPLTPEVPERSL